MDVSDNLYGSLGSLSHLTAAGLREFKGRGEETLPARVVEYLLSCAKLLKTAAPANPAAKAASACVAQDRAGSLERAACCKAAWEHSDFRFAANGKV